MLNKKQLNFLKYVSKPREKSKVVKRFPKCKENGCIYAYEFSNYFDKLPCDKLVINDMGRTELAKHPVLANIEQIVVFLCTIIGAVCAVLSLL